MYTHVRKVGAYIQLVQESTLFRVVKQVVLRVRINGQTVVVRLSIVTADDTLLSEIAQ